MHDGSLAIDFGSCSSKMTLLYPERTEDQQIIKVSRVPLSIPLGDSERPQGEENGSMSYEFSAWGAVFGNRLEFGKRCQAVDSNFPLKAIMTYLAGICPTRRLSNLPGGPEIINALAAKEITPAMLHDVLFRYFCFLREQALKHAKKFRDPHRVLGANVSELLDPDIRFVSEGHSAAAYVYKRMVEDGSVYQQSALWEQFRHLYSNDGALTIVVLDSGGSTLNVEVLTIYFDEAGNILCMQSEADLDSCTGIQGGSHLLNDYIKDYITKAISEQNWPAGEKAVLLQKFEDEKRAPNTDECEAGIILVGSSTAYTIGLDTYNFRQSMRAAFKAGLAVTRKQIQSLLAKERSFAVVLCGGGSYCNPGLARQVGQILDEVEREGRDQGILIEHAVLADWDPSWKTAVATGAALFVWHTDELYNVFC
ncbi:hypothetical protein F4782DRAFT_534526 [Xylaria castorea]|nr:hypothetical protein F4782DRAFT_534526 [Xylaria castorea]